MSLSYFVAPLLSSDQEAVTVPAQCNVILAQLSHTPHKTIMSEAADALQHEVEGHGLNILELPATQKPKAITGFSRRSKSR